jgi:beta-galactosidase/beta-glucuronidase
VQLEPGDPPREIAVPFPFEAPLSGLGLGAEVHERLRYSRSFALPEDWRGSRVLLRFGAVDWRAEVSVDGRPAGGHTGGYTSFTLDLGALDPDAEHELVVDVEDPAEGFQMRGKQRGGGGIWYRRTTGIWQPVRLEAVPDVYVRALELEPAVDGTVRVHVETSAPDEVEVRVRGETLRFAAPGAASLTVPAPELWSPERPRLYPVEVETAGGDAISTYTAFRSVERRGSEILLNGEPIRLAGVLDQGFWPGGVYAAPDDDALRTDVEAAKELGFNLARMHVKVADPRWYEWCDRLGLLVAQDLPSSHDLSTEEARAQFVREADQILAQLRGHPSVAIWIAFNEHWGEPPPDFQRSVVRRIRAADRTRLVVDASGWNQLDDTDLRDVHDYGDDLSAHESPPDSPLWVGECGGVSLVPPGRSEDFAYKHASSPDELAEAYARLVGGLGDVAGFVWTQLTDVEGELNGLLTDERAPKADPAAIRAANERFLRRMRD